MAFLLLANVIDVIIMLVCFLWRSPCPFFCSAVEEGEWASDVLHGPGGGRRSRHAQDTQERGDRHIQNKGMGTWGEQRTGKSQQNRDMSSSLFPLKVTSSVSSVAMTWCQDGELGVSYSETALALEVGVWPKAGRNVPAQFPVSRGRCGNGKHSIHSIIGLCTFNMILKLLI